MTARCPRPLARFLKVEDGVTSVEYAALTALLLGACLAAILALAPAAGLTFNATTTSVGSYGVE